MQAKKKKHNKKYRTRVSTIVLVLVFLAGLSLMLYPTVADWWNSFHQSQAVAGYIEKSSSMTTDDYDQMFAAAQAYNEKLAENGPTYEMTDEEKAEYNSLLDITGTGIMGYINIPEIDVELPIYHGTEESVLQIAVGHLEWTSLPVGGESTHTVLSGHRGLPSAKLFTDIVELKEGDTFTLNILDRTLTYEVDQIRTVLPDELDDLQIEEGKDYCTLVTCTPYGVNTHRLLVRGHRIANAAGEVRVTADATKIDPVMVAPFIAGFIAVILLIWLFSSAHAKNRERRLIERFRREQGKTDDKTTETK